MMIDYSALNQPITKTDVTAYRLWKSGGKLISMRWAYITIGGLGAFFGGWLIATAIVDPASIATPLTWFIIFGLLTAVIALIVRRDRRYFAKLYKFASANNIELITGLVGPAYPGMIFQEGHSRILVESYRLPDDTQIGNYRYETGSGKSRQTHSWCFVRIKLPRRLPHMVLDARGNNLFGRISNLPDSFRGQTLSLEGDFDKYFALYAPKQYERDALYIFTPDVMAAVIDAGKAYDMEVIDDDLILFSKGRFNLKSEPELRTLLGISGIIRQEIHHQAKRYADERAGDRTLNVIAEPGRRLKSRLSVSAIVAIVFVLIYFVFVLWPQ